MSIEHLQSLIDHNKLYTSHIKNQSIFYLSQQYVIMIYYYCKILITYTHYVSLIIFTGFLTCLSFITLFNKKIIDLSLQMIRKIIIAILLVLTVRAAIDNDLVPNVPGFPDTFKQRVWSGYLNTSSSTRKLHYVFIESANNNGTNTPVTLWLNGGPGCSSLLGYLQQIGPYYLQEGARYKVGDKLIENPYSWHTVSHLLFIQSPAGVGYSINTDTNFSYSDPSTANDNIDALQYFFANFAQYSNNPFWMTGESYAGKYIPDLAVLIDYYNNGGSGKKINLKGIMVGNGIMTFQNGQLQKRSMEYMIDHEFIDVDLLPYYRGSCFIDQQSAGCRYFRTRYNQNVDQINPYNVYSYCFYNDSFLNEGETKKNYQSQASILKNIISNNGTYSQQQPGKNGAPCAFFDGLVDYFNAHVKEYHGQSGMKWNGPCAEDVSGKYHISLGGSMKQYRYLLNKLGDYHITLYSGDWDDVVPYTDTIKNLQNLNLKQSYLYTPFFANNQHAGFVQVYNGVVFTIVKGASHQVPQSKRAQALVLFKTTIGSHNGPSKVESQ